MRILSIKVNLTFCLFYNNNIVVIRQAPDGKSFTLFVQPNHMIPSLRFLQQQTYGADCGLFVPAFAYTLCAGAILEKMTYKQHARRSHLKINN